MGLKAMSAVQHIRLHTRLDNTYGHFGFVCSRSLLGLPLSVIADKSFAALAKLIYRDNVRQKHQKRDRLVEEIQQLTVSDAKDFPSKAKQRVLADSDSAPMADLLLKHMICVPRQQYPTTKQISKSKF